MANEDNTRKYLEYIDKVMRLMGSNIEAVVNVLETAKNNLVKVTSSFALNSGTSISISLKTNGMTFRLF